MKGRQSAYPDLRPPWRGLRWPVNIDVSLQEHRSCPLDVKLLDISVSGARLLAGYRVRIGGMAILRIPGLQPVKGEIVWSREWQAAMHFYNPLHLAVVQHIVSLSEDPDGLPAPPFEGESLSRSAC